MLGPSSSSISSSSQQAGTGNGIRPVLATTSRGRLLTQPGHAKPFWFPVFPRRTVWIGQGASFGQTQAKINPIYRVVGGAGGALAALQPLCLPTNRKLASHWLVSLVSLPTHSRFASVHPGIWVARVVGPGILGTSGGLGASGVGTIRNQSWSLACDKHHLILGLTW